MIYIVPFLVSLHWKIMQTGIDIVPDISIYLVIVNRREVLPSIDYDLVDHKLRISRIYLDLPWELTFAMHISVLNQLS